MRCPPLETIVGWYLAEASDADTDGVEEHLFECDRCTRRAERIDAMVRSLKSTVPPVLTAERRRRLEERASSLPRVPVEPGARATIHFRTGTEIGFWLMRSDLEGVERVDCDLLALDGRVLVSFPDVPFDAERREVVLACQTHYAALGYPPDLKARLTSFEKGGGQRSAEYTLIHEFSFDDT